MRVVVSFVLGEGRFLLGGGETLNKTLSPRPPHEKTNKTKKDHYLNAANWQWLSASAFFAQYYRVYSPGMSGRVC